MQQWGGIQQPRSAFRPEVQAIVPHEIERVAYLKYYRGNEGKTNESEVAEDAQDAKHTMGLMQHCAMSVWATFGVQMHISIR
jgi:hypothetical protein